MRDDENRTGAPGRRGPVGRIWTILVIVLVGLVLLRFSGGLSMMAARAGLWSLLLLVGGFFALRWYFRLPFRLPFEQDPKAKGPAASRAARRAEIPVEAGAGTDAEAEARAERLFENLPQGCLALHDLPGGEGRIGHLLVSREKGAMIVETLALCGEVTAVNGRLLVDGRRIREDLVRDAVARSVWMRERLRQAAGVEADWVGVALVFPNAFVAVRQPVNGVDVFNAGHLGRWLERQPPRPYAAALWTKRESLSQLLLG